MSHVVVWIGDQIIFSDRWPAEGHDPVEVCKYHAARAFHDQIIGLREPEFEPKFEEEHIPRPRWVDLSAQMGQPYQYVNRRTIYRMVAQTSAGRERIKFEIENEVHG